MSTTLALDARQLQELLQAVVLRVRDIRGIVLVDRDGLPLVSTLQARSFEESLAAFTGAAEALLSRARQDFKMGPLHVLRLAGRDRQVLVVPVARGFLLLAVVEAAATPAVVESHLLALARSVLVALLDGSESSEA
jgi:predicted regulator of Ras-like GTPase activity (Roadblock/LC7/MglB family)